MISEVDIERATHEMLPQKYQVLLDKGWYGAFRYATYIENYCSYDTYKQFIQNATEDDLVEMEMQYLSDFATRKYSKSFKMFLSDEQLDKITEKQWKKILRSDIVNFYENIMKGHDLMYDN